MKPNLHACVLLQFLCVCATPQAQTAAATSQPETKPGEGMRLLRQARAALRANRLAEALPQLELACRILEADGDRATLAEAWHMRGRSLTANLRVAEAVQAYERCLELHAQIYGGAPQVDTAKALINLAGCLTAQNRHTEAMDRYRAAAEMIGGLEKSRVNAELRAVALRGIGDLHLVLRNAQSAHEALDQALECFGTSGMSRARGQCLECMARCLRLEGKLREALAKAEEALAVFESLGVEGRSDVPNTLRTMAACHLWLGHPHEALPLVERALQEAVGPGIGAAAKAELEAMRGRCLRSLSQSAEASEAYAKALSLLEQAGGSAVRKANFLQMQADCALESDRVMEALGLAREAAELVASAKGASAQDRAAALRMLATCRIQAGEPAEAEADLRQALEIARAGLPRGEVEASILQVLAIARERAGDFEQAERHLRNAIAIESESGCARRHVAEARLGILLVAQKRSKDGIAMLQSAFEHIDEERARATSLAEEDRAFFYLSMGPSEVVEALVRALVATGRTSDAFNYVERSRGRSLLDLLERGKLGLAARAAAEARNRSDLDSESEILRSEAAVRAARTEVDRLAIEAWRVDGSEKLREARAKLVAASRTLAEADRALGRLVREQVPMAKPADHGMVLRGLAQDELVLAYLFGQQESFVFLLARGQDVQCATLPITKAQLQQRVEDYLTEGRTVARDGGAGERVVAEQGAEVRLVPGHRPGKASPKAKAAPRLGWELYKTLVPDEYRPALAKASVVNVIGHGALHLLPMEMLVVADPSQEPGQQPRYWISGSPMLTYASSATVLLRAWERASVPTARRALVALGDPSFERWQKAGTESRVAATGTTSSPQGEATRLRIPGMTGEIEHLPGTRAEVDGIEDLFRRAHGAGSTHVLTAGSATETQLHALALEARILHLASHCRLFDVGQSVQAAILLTPPERLAAEDDGLLRISDLTEERWRQRLEGCDLVVLSACETQRGRWLPEEGYMSLTWGFLYAGASSVISTLWQVHDQKTAELMKEFYRLMLEGAGTGRERLRALWLARQKLQQQPGSTPHHWAPFVYTGSAATRSVDR